MRKTTIYRMLFILGAGALLVGALATAPVASASPQGGWQPGKYITINDPQAPGLTEAASVNDFGMVGGMYLDPTVADLTHGFVELNGKYTTIDDPLAGTGASSSSVSYVGTSVTGVNDFGEIAGTYSPANLDDEGFVDIGGHFTTIRDPLADDVPFYGTYVWGVNNLGELVGSYYDSEGTVHGFIDVAGHFTTIPDAPGAGTGSGDPSDYAMGDYGTVLFSVNDLGTIAGASFEQNGDVYGFTYSHGRFTEVPSMPGFANSVATFVNDSGMVGIVYWSPNTNDNWFVYSNGALTAIPAPPGDSLGYVEGANNLGDLAGYYTDASGNMYGFVLTAAP